MFKKNIVSAIERHKHNVQNMKITKLKWTHLHNKQVNYIVTNAIKT